MRTILSVLVLVLLSETCMTSVLAREWTDRKGRKIEAEFVRLSLSRVFLKKPDGSEIIIKLGLLSDQDIAHVRVLNAPEPPPGAVQPNNTPAGQGTAETIARLKPDEIIRFRPPQDAGLNYLVKVATTFSPDKPPPMIIAFDPNASAFFMVEQIAPAAETFGWTVVGCNKLKNGMTNTRESEKYEDIFLEEILKNIPHDPEHIVLAGFSGGALRAYLISSRRKELNFAGIIAYGGWMGDGGYGLKRVRKNMRVAMINGTTDTHANSRIAPDTKRLEKDNGVVKTFPFPGGHLIAPPAITRQAIEWMKEGW